MKLRVNPEIFVRFPKYERYVVVACGVENTEDGGGLMERLHALETTLRADSELVEFKNHPRLASWRELFADLGVNPNQCLPSIVALVKRVLNGSDIPFINPLVAVMNIVSLSHLAPCGGDDLDSIRGDLILGFAEGNETYIPLGKPEAREFPKPGEVIYFDNSSLDVLCRAWCWRNGHTTRITPVTKRVAINIDILPPISSKEGQSTAEELASLVEKTCGGQIQICHLHSGNPSVEMLA